MLRFPAITSRKWPIDRNAAPGQGGVVCFVMKFNSERREVKC
jgi:hypothetical protein